MLEGREKEKRLKKNESNQEKKKDRKESFNMKKNAITIVLKKLQ
jgi:hypothetical protein